MFVLIGPFPAVLIPALGSGALGGVGAGAKIANFKAFATILVSRFDYLLIILGVLSLFFVSFLLVYVFLKLYSYFFVKSRIRKTKNLLHRFYTELILFKSIGEFDEKKRLEIQLSFEESMYFITKRFKNRFIIKRIGMHHSKRILDGLHLITNKKLKSEEQLALVKNLIDLVVVYLK